VVEPDVATLLDRCRQGDELAWEALVRRFQSRVYAVALQYVRNPDDARDVAQDIFVKLYQRLGTFRGHETFLPWLLRLSRNACIDHLRRRKARPPRTDIPVDEGPQLPAPGPDPHESWAVGHRRRLVWRALQRLTEANREMIVLKEIHGLNLQEIADLLEIPMGTVKSRSNRARLELARAIQAMEAAG
jgi:RNA polymerase sigma-70 factor (ECF subfamily)